MLKASMILSVMACLGVSFHENPFPWITQMESAKVGSFSVQKFDSAYFINWTVEHSFTSNEYVIQEIFPETNDTLEIKGGYGVEELEDKVEYYYVDSEKRTTEPLIRLKIIPKNDSVFFTDIISLGF